MQTMQITETHPANLTSLSPISIGGEYGGETTAVGGGIIMTLGLLVLFLSLI